MTVCSEPGCPELTREGACPAHRRERQPDQRPTAASRGYDHRWKVYAERFRAEHPWCRTCLKQGRRQPTQAVDHITPVTGPEDPRFWDPTNHQPLCRSCHAVKTAAEGRTQRTVAAAPTARWWVV